MTTAERCLSGGAAPRLIDKFRSLPGRARCSVWRRLASALKEVSGGPENIRERTLRSLETLLLPPRPRGGGATGAAGERDCDKVPRALPRRLGWLGDRRPSAGPWRGSSLARSGAGRGWRAGALPAVVQKPLLRLDSFTLTQQAGRAMCWRGTERHKKALNRVQISTKA